MRALPYILLALTFLASLAGMAYGAWLNDRVLMALGVTPSILACVIAYAWGEEFDAWAKRRATRARSKARIAAWRSKR